MTHRTPELEDVERRTAIGITVFRPDWPLLQALIGQLLGAERVPVALYVDGPTGEAVDTAVLDALRSLARVHLIQSPENRGIGAALNGLCEAAGRLGCSRLLLFDQDSSPMTGLIQQLNVAMDVLQEGGFQPAVVGPRLVLPVGEIGKSPRYRSRGVAQADASQVDYVVTSGSLFDLAALRRVGPFRSDFFIDGIDIEWCFRAWARGFSVWLLNTAELPHRVGRGVVRLGPVAFPGQSEERMAFYIRNQVSMLRLLHVPAWWKLRTLAYVPVQALSYVVVRRGTPRLLKRFWRAAREGWARHTPLTTGS